MTKKTKKSSKEVMKKRTTTKPTERLPTDEMRPDLLGLAEHPIDLPGPAGTKPSMILMFDCDKCKAHAFMEVNDMPDLRYKRLFTKLHMVPATTGKREDGRLKVDGYGFCGIYRFAEGFVRIPEEGEE